MGNTPTSQKDLIKQAAARWVLVLTSSDCSGEQRQAFEQWRLQNPVHELVFERAMAAWERADRLAALRPASQSIELDLLAPQGGLVDSHPIKQNSTSVGVRAWFHGAARVAAAALVLVCVLLSWPEPTVAYATGIGEHRIVLLQDGSKIELNTNSKIRVLLTDDLRQISLEKGEALFTVAHDEMRPFVVVAGQAQLRAVGTVFNVRRKTDALQVTVIDGAVQVETAAAGQNKAPAVSLLTKAVSETINSTGTTAHTLSGEQVNQLLSWRVGLLEFRSEPLIAAVAEINRYNLRQLQVVDPAIAELRIGGYFQTDNLDAFIEFLITSFPIEATKNAQGDVVLRSKQKSTAAAS